MVVPQPARFRIYLDAVPPFEDLVLDPVRWEPLRLQEFQDSGERGSPFAVGLGPGSPLDGSELVEARPSFVVAPRDALGDDALVDLVRAQRLRLLSSEPDLSEVEDGVDGAYRACLRAHWRDEFERRRTSLSQRELEFFDELLRGLPTKTVALRLNVSIKTAHSHRASILQKFGLSSLAEVFALRLRCVDPELTIPAPEAN